MQPGLARIRGSMLILITTAHKRSGLLYQKWRDAYGRNDPDVLVVKGTTLQFNPTFDAKIRAADRQRPRTLSRRISERMA